MPEIPRQHIHATDMRGDQILGVDHVPLALDLAGLSEFALETPFFRRFDVNDGAAEGKRALLGDAGKNLLIVAAESLATLPRHRDWVLRQNKWRAGRHGLDTDLIADEQGRLEPARQAIVDLVAEVTPSAQRLGCADELAFVADSQRAETRANNESFADLRRNLADNGIAFEDIAVVIQFNKRDLADIRPDAEIDAVSQRIVAAVEKATGGTLRR